MAGVNDNSYILQPSWTLVCMYTFSCNAALLLCLSLVGPSSVGLKQARPSSCGFACHESHAVALSRAAALHLSTRRGWQAATPEYQGLWNSGLSMQNHCKIGRLLGVQSTGVGALGSCMSRVLLRVLTRHNHISDFQSGMNRGLSSGRWASGLWHAYDRTG